MYANIEDAKLFYSNNDNFMHKRSECRIKEPLLNNVKLKIGIKH